jgi:hypothetical protein
MTPMRAAVVRRAVRAGAAATLLAGLWWPASAMAQTPRRAPVTRVYLGMWSTHLNAKKPAIDPNWLVGVSHGKAFAATFINSFGRRAFAAGLQLPVVSGHAGWLGGTLGARLGALTGYDERFWKIAKDTPVLPLIQAFGQVDVGRLGIEADWTWVVASVTFSVRF